MRILYGIECIVFYSLLFFANYYPAVLRHSWDTPVSRILPDYCHFSDQYLTEHVTIRDILSHRTGIDRNYDAVWYSGIFNRTELFKFVLLPEGSVASDGLVFSLDIVH